MTGDRVDLTFLVRSDISLNMLYTDIICIDCRIFLPGTLDKWYCALSGAR